MRERLSGSGAVKRTPACMELTKSTAGKRSAPGTKGTRGRGGVHHYIGDDPPPQTRCSLKEKNQGVE